MGVLKRYRYRADPTGEQQGALARVFGCCRVVFNDTIAAREAARGAGEQMPTATELSQRLLTAAKQTWSVRQSTFESPGTLVSP